MCRDMDGSRECNIEVSKSSESERKVAQSCPTLCDPMDPTRLLCPWNFPGKSTRVDYHFLLQRFPDPGIEAGSPALQADALPSEPPRKHKCINACMWNMKKKWYRQSYLQSRNRVIDIENKCLNTKGEMWVGWIRRLRLTCIYHWYMYKIDN